MPADIPKVAAHMDVLMHIAVGLRPQGLVVQKNCQTLEPEGKEVYDLHEISY